MTQSDRIAPSAKASAKPVLKYPGSKWRLADWILFHLPPHDSYLEPFLGSGAVFFRKPPCRLETLGDVSGDVSNLFRVVRERRDELIAAVETTPWAREEYERALDALAHDPESRRRSDGRLFYEDHDAENALDSAGEDKRYEEVTA